MATIVPMSWGSGNTPPIDCYVRGSYLTVLNHDHSAALWRCADGSSNAATPICPVDTYKDFTNYVCVPTTSGLESLLSLSVADGQSLAWQMIAVFAIAWGIRQVAQLLKEKHHVEES